jgi:hypothetical protein
MMATNPILFLSKARPAKIDFTGAQKRFSTMHRLASLQRQNSRKSAQTVAFAAAPLRRHGARKTFKSRCMKSASVALNALDVDLKRWIDPEKRIPKARIDIFAGHPATAVKRPPENLSERRKARVCFPAAKRGCAGSKKDLERRGITFSNATEHAGFFRCRQI